MSLTFSQTQGNGSTLSYPIVAKGGYFEDTDIAVELITIADGTITEQTKDTDYTIENNNVIFTVAPTSDYYVRIRRRIDNESTYSDFTRGNAFGATNLNNSFLYALYQMQQLADGFRPDDFYWKSNTNAGNQKLVNLADGENPGDAVNYGQVEELIAATAITSQYADEAAASAAAAEASADDASDSKDAAAASATAAASSKDAAASSATSAASSATNASTYASNASTSASNSATSASAAATSATSANTSATAAAASATAASTSATSASSSAMSAATSASDASTSATSAASSATSASTSATAAAASAASVDYSASGVLTKLLTVDGPGSGLNADLLDGEEGSYYSPIVSSISTRTTTGTWTITGLTIGKPLIIGMDGNAASADFAASFYVMSGASIGRTSSSSVAFLLGAYGSSYPDLRTTPSFVIIPTSTEVVLNIINLTVGGILLAYH